MKHFCPKRPQSKGQGIVEYAGAIVVVAVIIAAIIAMTPDYALSLSDMMVMGLNYLLTLVPAG